MGKVMLGEMTWKEVAEAIEGGARVVVIPVGATEQHGPHLPLLTDTLMVESAARMAAERAGGVLVAPVIPYGTSDNHIDFPGTASLRLDTLRNLLVDVGRTLAGHGFDVIVLLNGHGGNTAAIAAAAHELRQVTNKVIAAVPWYAYIKESHRVMESKISWHADEFETSLMLCMHPERVQMDRAVNEMPRPFPLFEFTHEALLSARVDLGLPRTRAVVDSGTFGEARLATAEKGRACVEEAIAGLAGVLKELHGKGAEIAKRYTPD
ncbi:MAG: creatininase family protein [Armatimonadetes bacterium]|nr:creatininase family protein [Armatimonadota bacterium]